MPTQQIFIGKDDNGNPLLLEGASILLDNGDELALSPRTTSGWQWTLRFLSRNEIDLSQLTPEEQQILVGGSLFEESSYSSSPPPPGEGNIAEAETAADADADLLTEDQDVQLLPDGLGFEEGLFLYEVSVDGGTTISGRIRRRRPI